MRRDTVVVVPAALNSLAFLESHCRRATFKMGVCASFSQDEQTVERHVVGSISAPTEYIDTICVS